MSKLIKAISVGALTTAMGTQVSVAQENMFSRDRIVGAGERYHAEFEQRDIRSGSFVLRPELGLGVSSNSNIFAQEMNEQSDVVLTAAPRFSANSDWSNHGFGLDLRATHNEYADISDESNTNFGGGLRGRIDITRDMNIELKGGYDQLTEGRGVTGAPNQLASPAEYTVGEVGAQLNWASDRTRFSAGVDYDQREYDDLKFDPVAITAANNAGTPLNPDRSFRDFVETSANARFDYAINPDIAVFVQAVAHMREYDTILADTSSDGVNNRDANGVTFEIGTNFQLSQLIRGEVAVGYLEEDHDDADFDKIDGLAADIDVQWLPTELTKFSVGVDRSVRDYGLIEFPSALVTNATLRVDHELMRNVLLNASAGISKEEYDGTVADFTQDYTTFSAGAVYKMNSNAHFDLSLSYRDAEAGGSARGRIYDQTVVGVGVKLFL